MIVDTQAIRSNNQRATLAASPVTGPTLSPSTPAVGAARTPSTPDNTPPVRLPLSGFLSPLTPRGGVVGGVVGGVGGGVTVVLVILPRSTEIDSVEVSLIVNV